MLWLTTCVVRKVMRYRVQCVGGLLVFDQVLPGNTDLPDKASFISSKVSLPV